MKARVWTARAARHLGYEAMVARCNAAISRRRSGFE
jgi:hypothetical protein